MEHPTIRLSVRALVLSVAFGLVHGCAAPGGGELQPGPRMKIRQGCLRTACQQRRSTEARQCSDCTSACFSAGYSCDVSSACEISCERSRACSAWEHEECVSEGFEVTLPNNPSPTVEAGCLRTRSAIEACGFEAVQSASDCARLAATSRPDVAAAYECFVAASCGRWETGDLAHCSLPGGDFGDRLCAGLAGLCGEGCSDEARQTLNAETGWLRDDVIDAAMTCVEQASCDDALDCYDAWAAAVYGS